MLNFFKKLQFPKIKRTQFYITGDKNKKGHNSTLKIYKNL